MIDSSEALRASLRAQIAAVESSSTFAETTSKVPQRGVVEISPVFDAVSFTEEAERAFRKIERLSCVRERATVELRTRLIREEFEESAVEDALARACACGLVDDARYADVLVRSRLSQGRGKRGIAAELERLDISASEVAALSESGDSGDDSDEIQRALHVLDKKPPRSKNRREAAYRRLAQKGFSASVSTSAARLWCEAHCE